MKHVDIPAAQSAATRQENGNPLFHGGSTSRAVPLNLTSCAFFKLSGARLSGIVAWW
jgi:hypothetical protein